MSLERLTQLKSLDVGNNMLSGEPPDSPTYPLRVALRVDLAHRNGQERLVSNYAIEDSVRGRL